MNQNIKKRITAFNNEEAVRFFFELLNTFISVLDIGPDNEKIAFNVRNDHRKRISINLNSRLVLTIKDTDILGVMVNQEDLPKVESVASIVSQDYFKDQEPQTVLLFIKYEILRKNVDVIKPLWLKSCKEYEPAQKKTQYKRYHVPALYEMAMDENLLNPYFDGTIVMKNTFFNIINELREYLKGEDNVLSEFTIPPIKSNSYWVWISDHHQLIGSKNAHYEIGRKENSLDTFIHFEHKLKEKKDIFSRMIETIPDDVEWIDWRKSKSIRHKNSIDINDPEIIEKLSAQLLYLEEHLGDAVRNVITSSGDRQINKKSEMNISLNQILYGPPGTGKTYNTINKALKIINEKEEQSLDWNDRAAVKKLFNQRIEEERIVFTTFHQSMSYEDFVEGIKPEVPEQEGGQVTYKVQNGIFKEMARRAEGAGTRKKTMEDAFKNKRFYKMSIGGKNEPETHDWCIENNVVGLGWGGDKDYTDLMTFKDWNSFKEAYKQRFPEWANESKYNMQAVFMFQKMKIGDIVVATKGNHEIDAIGILKSEYYFSEDKHDTWCQFRDVDWIATDMKELPSMFFNKNVSQQTIYEFNPKDIKGEAFVNYFKSSEAQPRPHILIIDEINRGNVSQIFGELITLIEEDKRMGKDEALKIVLPYSKTKFWVPSNLFIIGTMNTADRSVEALDTALRRRFSFEEMPPKPELIAEAGALKEKNGLVGDIDLVLVLTTINERIEKLLDKDHLIGHSYFMSVTNLEELKSAFQNKIIPLLQEYFFGDYGKIGLVLGEGFFEEKEKENRTLFAKFREYEADDFATRAIYKLKNFTEEPNTNNEEFIKAINTLLGK